MRNQRFWSAVFTALLLIAWGFPLFGQDDPARTARAGIQRLLPPVDCIPPNLIPADLPEDHKGPTGLVQQPDNSYESRYRGVVSANVDNSNPRDEVIADFGANGVWAHDGIRYSGTWHQISGVNPDWIFSVDWGATAGDGIIGDFGSLGLWEWGHSGYPGVWTQLSGVNPDQGFSVDDDGDSREEIQIDFGSLGLWRYDKDTGVWTQYSAFNPLLGGTRKDMWNTGNQEGTWGFAGHGVWSFHTNQAAGGLFEHQLSGADPSAPNVSAAFGAGGGPEQLIMNFGSTLGTWVCQGTVYPDVTWNQISAYYLSGAAPARFVGDADTELLVDFANNTGFWLWDHNGVPGDWELLSVSDPGDGFFEPFDPNGYSDETNGDEEVAVDFDSQGLWLYDRTTGAFTLLSSSNPLYMVRSRIYDSGTMDEGLIAAFGTAGLWAYDGYGNFWQQISGLSPD